ncbi:jg13307 [Pararge aegeria aegeria]|uniref:Jg13307 protein n=1 Tax=Pararge aegeria aegeria TaxID=348720 RepID=A0A8S4RDV5_9NEOP|nr:jg13307 [Pararge aegeria aegeria]
MNYYLSETPLARTELTKDKMAQWMEGQRKAEALENIDVFGKPTDKQLNELNNVRKLSKELQENLQVSFRHISLKEIKS